MLKLTRRLTGLCLSFALGLGAGALPSVAGPFSAAITVNDKTITEYDLSQRVALLRVIGTQGDLAQIARSQLIDERLQVQAAEAAGIRLTDETLRAGMAEFAGRANMELQPFLTGIAGQGVAEETLRDFVRASLSWRELVGEQFAAQVRVTEADIDRALAAQTAAGGLQVQLGEIIMPFGLFDDPETVMARARQLQQVTSTAAFAEAARTYSAANSAAQGGVLPWRALSDLPEALRPLIANLAPGEVTQPIELQGAVALFQLRALSEGQWQAPRVSALDYAVYHMPGGRSEATLTKARALTHEVDRCDDLYGVAKGQPQEVLQRFTLPPAQVPTDIAYELSKLDADEISLALTRDGGDTLLFVMLCNRTTQAAEAIDRGQLRQALRSRRIMQTAESYLAQLRAEARIIQQ